MRNTMTAITKSHLLQAERQRIAQVRIMLMDIVTHTNQPHVKKLAEDALAVINKPHKSK